jgi:glycine dehydrogenase subunit 1
MAYIPHTPEDVAQMLQVIGVNSIEDLFDEIPAELRAGVLNVPPPLSEMEIGRLMMTRAAIDGRPLNFIGAGAYEHHIPAPVWAIATRGEFYSAYTPYQAEASQGTLQLIYEYQSMMCALTGMEVSNASLYDGASALAEACLMAVRSNRHSTSRRVLMPRTVNPTYAQLRTGGLRPVRRKDAARDAPSL